MVIVIGAGLAGLISEACGWLLYLVLLRTHISIWQIARLAGLTFICNIPTWLLLEKSADWRTQIVCYPLGLLLIITAYRLTGLIRREDLALFKK